MIRTSTETVDGVVWEITEIPQGLTIQEIKNVVGEKPWTRNFVQGEQLYQMTVRFEPISGDYRIEGIINGDSCLVIGNVNRRL